MMIAIIGTGFAGLATGWFLSTSGCRVAFFDKKGIGQGASGIATGLLHPYVGEEARRSLWANEALAEAKALLSLAPQAILEEGILRVPQSEKQRLALLRHCVEHGDVELLLDGHFLIHSGLVIDTSRYLQMLYQACASKGAVFQHQEITTLSELESFDHVVLALGHNAAQLLPQIKEQVSRVKGQVVSVALNASIKTTITKGYMAKSAKEGVYHWGATYEKQFTDEEPDLVAALTLLEQHKTSLPPEAKILDCRAGVRLARRGHYIPFVDRVEKNIWCIGALGSRGLLYHALLGHRLAKAIMNENEALIPKECRLKRHES
ncbi:MAG: FAD-binding oxidoreductase [Simkania sp.]|nr:FAD-binding oxidoreductase [Simkania sp.]